MKKGIIYSIPVVVAVVIAAVNIIWFPSMTDPCSYSWSVIYSAFFLIYILVIIGLLVLVICRKKKRRVSLIWIGLFGAGLVIMVLSSFSGEMDSKQNAYCQRQLMQIYTSLQLYAEDNMGYFPPAMDLEGLKVLKKSRYLSAKTFFCKQNQPDAEELTNENCSFRYHGGLDVKSPSDTVLLCDKPGNHPDGSFNYVTVSGTLHTIREDSLFRSKRLKRIR